MQIRLTKEIAVSSYANVILTIKILLKVENALWIIGILIIKMNIIATQSTNLNYSI